MQIFKTLAIAGTVLLMAAPAVKAQDIEPGQVHQTRVDSIVGQAGKVILIKEYMGSNDIRLSHNGKYVFGASGDDEESASFIYELATGKSIFVPNCVVGEVIDFGNYVTTCSIIRNGVAYEYDTKGLSCSAPIRASENLDVITMYTHIGQPYTMVVFDGNGQLIDTMPHYEQELTSGYGSLLWGLSADGMIGTGKSSLHGAFSNNSPAFWDRSIDKTFSLTDILSARTDGQMNYVSSDGCRMVGERSDIAFYVEYDRTAHAISSTKEIRPEPGYTINLAGCVENNRIIGFDQRESVDVYSRRPWIYLLDEERKIFLDEYISNLYGLDMESQYSMFTPGYLNSKGTVITGTSYEGGAWLPYIIFLNEEQVHPKARALAVRQIRNTVNVDVRWQEAMKGDYTVKEYNIYCDSVLVRTVPATTTENYSYTHTSVEAGPHFYQIQAVYTDGGVSDFTEKVQILVVGAGECLPVREIDANIVYNRTVKLTWGLPTSSISKGGVSDKVKRAENTVMKIAASGKKAAAKYVIEEGLDRVSLFNTNIESASASVRIGDYIYVTDYRNNAFTIFNALSGNRVKTVEVPGLGFVYDITYHDNVIYCVCNTNTVYMVRIDRNDPLELTLSNQLPIAAEGNHIAYIEGQDGGEDMLMLGSYESLLFYKTNWADAGDNVSGIADRFDISGLVISGSAYHNGRVYLANQAAGGSVPLVEVFDFNSGEHLFSSDLSESFPDLVAVADYPSYPITMAGLTIGTLEDGTVTLECMTQPLVSYNYVASVEIESSPDIAGYKVYRNGDLLAGTDDDPLESRHFVEEIFEPGKYVYAIEYVAKNGCKKMSDEADWAEVEIFSTGSCEAPGNVEAKESNKMAIVSWDLPSSTNGLVGFNVYRNGEQIAERLVDDRFIDQSGLEKGKYKYFVEAFYENSCVASDSVEIDITFEGKQMPPSAVRVEYSKETGKETFEHTTSWALPFFEEPLALGYGGISVQSAGFDGTMTMYAAIGWTAEDMGTFDDLWLVGMEFVLGTNVRSWNALVYVDDRQVYNQPINDARQSPHQWVRTYFSKPFQMKQEKEIAVGYMVGLNAANEQVVSFDMGPTVAPGKSDLISPDGETFYSAKASGVDANVSINALVVRQRDLEQASKTNNPQAYIESKVMRVSSAAADLTPIQSYEGSKTTSESYTLKGFNVYRDSKKINENLLTDMSFTENGVEPGEYEYYVGAVYADGEEELSESLFINNQIVANRTGEEACPVVFYPNPVRNSLSVKGEYASLQLVDMTGRVLMDNISNVQNIDMAKLHSGVYFINVTAVNGNVYMVKIIKK